MLYLGCKWQRAVKEIKFIKSRCPSVHMYVSCPLPMQFFLGLLLALWLHDQIPNSVSLMRTRPSPAISWWINVFLTAIRTLSLRWELVHHLQSPDETDEKMCSWRPSEFCLLDENLSITCNFLMKKCNCIGPTIRIGREVLCLPYAVFFQHACLFWFSLGVSGHTSLTKQLLPIYTL